ncbi:M81 family metallopeptidase [Flexivirga meconopsidis]|uniref:M81 family metallopeptidase n=1 Tax=Flexivirga meconopsidis TaxID=2977121 RepID=UPI00223F2913
MIVGIGTECSSFAPHRTTLTDFGIRSGDRLLERYPFLPVDDQVDFVPGFVARALPGGPVERSAYDELLARLLAVVRAGSPWDGVLLDIHGAMLVDGLDDPEGQLAAAVREAAGRADVLIAAAMDLHGQVSREFAATVDLPTCYRTAPHVDEEATRERAARLLVRGLRSASRPARAWCRIPVALPGEKTSTRVEPAAGLYRSVSSTPDGVWETALWMGYPWADQARASAAVVSMGDDESAVRTEAARVAREMVDARDDFAFCGPSGSLRWALDEAFGSHVAPFFVSDTGDNPTAGGSGDVVTTLRTLLADARVIGDRDSAVWSALVDPAAGRLAATSGVGATFAAEVGGCFGWPDRLRLTGTVGRLVEGPTGLLAVVRVSGLSVVLTERRTPFHTLADYERVGIDIRRTRLVINKIGYLEPELDDAAAGWVMALTEGPVDQRIEHLRLEKLTRPTHPFDELPADWTPAIETW